jgi:hypothetical protein
MINNDALLPVTPNMERFTVQAIAFTAALSLLPKHHLPDSRVTTTATFCAFLNDWMENNEHDELGNYADLVEWAVGL